MSWIRDHTPAEVRRARDALLEAEHELRDRIEAVAAQRRGLPLGPRLPTDYVFREGPRDLAVDDPAAIRETRLSELFAAGCDELLVQHMMFAPDAEQGCPMCSMWADGFDAVAHHVTSRVPFVVIARAPIERLRAWGRVRGWRRLRLLSSHDNDFNRDLGVEITPDRQLPALSVFVRRAGAIHHVYTTEGSLVERHHRMMDLYTPVWNLFDLLPGGRGGWMPRQRYED